jgi:hypothetical protein
MSAPTPQEIRDRLAKVESTLQQTWEQLSAKDTVSAIHIAALADAKTNVLHAAALTLLVEQQTAANKIAAAQVYDTMGPSMFSLARQIVEEARGA